MKWQVITITSNLNSAVTTCDDVVTAVINASISKQQSNAVEVFIHEHNQTVIQYPMGRAFINLTSDRVDFRKDMSAEFARGYLKEYAAKRKAKVVLYDVDACSFIEVVNKEE